MFIDWPKIFFKLIKFLKHNQKPKDIEIILRQNKQILSFIFHFFPNKRSLSVMAIKITIKWNYLMVIFTDAWRIRKSRNYLMIIFTGTLGSEHLRVCSNSLLHICTHSTISSTSWIRVGLIPKPKLEAKNRTCKQAWKIPGLVQNIGGHVK